MIDVQYFRDTNTTKIYTRKLTSLVKDEKILIKFKNIISNEIHYEVILGSDSWCVWNGSELITDVLVYDLDNVLLYEHKWDIIRDGDEIEKMLWFYLNNRQKLGKQSNGLIIGTHDGRNGHWIYSIKKGLSNATMIDGSEKQYQKLVENYGNYDGLTFHNQIVTVDGGEVSWFQGGEGYTDTVKKDVISFWLDDNQITSRNEMSISFKELIQKNDFDWVHLDVEGIDGDLILSLTKLPNVIIYESMNLEQEIEKKLNIFFQHHNYEVTECNGNTIATKKI